MATCKDCLHHLVCSVDRNNVNYFMLIGCVNVETNCINFTAKSIDKCEDCAHRDDPVICPMWINKGLCYRGMGGN